VNRDATGKFMHKESVVNAVFCDKDLVTSSYEHKDVKLKLNNDCSNVISYNRHIEVPDNMFHSDNQPWTIVDDML
jgi:hypothetical protein